MNRRYFLVLIFGLVVSIVWWRWPATAPSTPDVAQSEQRESRSTVAQNWQWESAAARTAKGAQIVGRINPAAVVRALGRVAFDANNKVVVDRNTRDVLDDYLHAMPDLKPEELEALQDTLQAGLPGPQGSRVARIVTDYYHYRVALQDFERSDEQLSTPEGERARLRSLAKLRDDSLGPVVARQFFAEDQAMQRYLLESKATTDSARLQQDLQDGVLYLDSRSSSEATELREQMELLRSQGASQEFIRYVRTQQLGLYTANVLPRPAREQSDWEQRYQRFKQERQQVLAGKMSEDDKQWQIDLLLVRYFSVTELEAIDAYSPH